MFRYKQWFSPFRVKVCLACIWLISPILHLPLVIGTFLFMSNILKLQSKKMLTVVLFIKVSNQFLNFSPQNCNLYTKFSFFYNLVISIIL